MKFMKSLVVPSIIIGGVNDEVDKVLLHQLTGVLLLDYDAVEGTGTALPCRLYIEAAGSKTDEESGKFFNVGSSTQRHG